MNKKAFSGIAGLMLIATLLLACLPVARAAPFGAITITNFTITSTAAKIVTSDQNISSVQVENLGTATAYIGVSSTVLSTTGQALFINNKATFTNVQNALWAITASSTADLRVTVTKGGGGVDTARLITAGISNNATSTTVGCSDGSNIVNCTPLIYGLTTAITANSTTTATAAGTMAVTSHATGRGIVFYSDGSNWQLTNGPTGFATSTSATIATTSTTDVYLIAPVTGSLTAAYFSSVSALAANDTNYITWTLVNLGQSGVGTTAMLAVSDANTTKTTGGTALTAVAMRSLTVHGTAANLLVVKGDVLRLRSTATGTLAGAVAGAFMQGQFTRSV